MQLAATHRPIDLSGATIARAVDFTDMPGMSLDFIAVQRVGAPNGWTSLDQARAAVLELTAEEGPQNPAAAIVQREGRFEAWELAYKPHGWDSSSARPLETYWSEGDNGYSRSRAGAGLVAIVENGAVHEPSSYASMRPYFTYD
jgi:hypothetical protein